MFPYFEWQYKHQILRFLTSKWYMLQGGNGPETLEEWNNVFKVLELDMKAKRDMMLLAQSGAVGRTHATKLLWKILSGPALDNRYQDLSNLVTNMVYQARRDFDRPPREHGDLTWWWWSCLDLNYTRDRRWSFDQVPTTWWTMSTGPGGRPLPPPECWGNLPAR